MPMSQLHDSNHKQLWYLCSNLPANFRSGQTETHPTIAKSDDKQTEEAVAVLSKVESASQEVKSASVLESVICISFPSFFCRLDTSTNTSTNISTIISTITSTNTRTSTSTSKAMPEQQYPDPDPDFGFDLEAAPVTSAPSAPVRLQGRSDKGTIDDLD